MSIALVAIVRDEAEHIDAFLDSAMGICGVATIVDTGSADATMERIEAHGIAVHQRPWEGYGISRSHAFALARGTADWLLHLDADMTVEWDEGWEPDPVVEAYMVPVRQVGRDDFMWRMPLLLRGDLPWEARGAVHYYTCLPDREFIRASTDAVRVRYVGRSSPEKTARQAEGLEKMLADAPNSPRNVFYLAQTYREMGRIEESRALYLRRAAMGGYAEEAFYAAYRAALLAPDWPTQATELIAAWEMRPTRLEPLYALVKGLNRRGQHFAAYAFARYSVEPVSDVLFIHESVWDWGMAFERSIAAWWVGQQDEARELGEALLVHPRLPDNVRAAVIRNLAFCHQELIFDGDFAMAVDALAMLVRIVVEKRPAFVLELGSGLSTLVLGMALRQLGHGHLVSAEHDPRWASDTRHRAKALGVDIDVVDAPLVEQDVNGETRPWYVLPPMPKVDFLVVDGPPSVSPDGLDRWPALPLLDGQLAEDASVFLDDAKRDGEQAVIARWAAEGWNVRLHATERGSAVLTRP